MCLLRTFGVCDLTFPARARDPWTLPMLAVYGLLMELMGSAASDRYVSWCCFLAGVFGESEKIRRVESGGSADDGSVDSQDDGCVVDRGGDVKVRCRRFEGKASRSKWLRSVRGLACQDTSAR